MIKKVEITADSPKENRVTVTMTNTFIVGDYPVIKINGNPDLAIIDCVFLDRPKTFIEKIKSIIKFIKFVYEN